MRELICIVCPVGCHLAVEENASDLTVSGSKCSRGVNYAKEEIRAPKRVVTATCRIAFSDSSTAGTSLTAPRRLPVKTSAPCPKEKINELLDDIYRLKVELPVKTGDKLIADWKGSGIDIIAVRSL